MNPRSAQTRDTVLLSLAVVIGVLVPPAFALIGLPLAAAGVAGLAYRGRMANAIIAIVVGLVGVAALDVLSGIPPVDVIFMAPALAAVVAAVIALPRVSYQWVGALLVSVLAVADGTHEYVLMRVMNETPRIVVDQMVTMMSGNPGKNAAAVQANRQLADLLLQLLPMAYFFTAFLTGVAVILAIVWAARRSDRTVKVPRLSQLDLTPHVVWPFIVALLALAASNSSLPYKSVMWTVGLNLLLSVRALFALQGFGVSAGVLDRTGVGRGGRIFALAALAALDAFTFAISFVGLLDLWINFRHLPRDGATPQSPTTAMSDRL